MYGTHPACSGFVTTIPSKRGSGPNKQKPADTIKIVLAGSYFMRIIHLSAG
jgi:hypothetical protein